MLNLSFLKKELQGKETSGSKANLSVISVTFVVS